MDPKNVLSIWLVVGFALLVNGILILGAGLYELMYPPENPVTLYQYHASIWWGALLAIIGAAYTWRFRPSRQQQEHKAMSAAVREEIHAK